MSKRGCTRLWKREGERDLKGRRRDHERDKRERERKIERNRGEDATVSN